MTRVAAISSTTSSIVAARDSTPPVHVMSPTVRKRTEVVERILALHPLDVRRDRVQHPVAAEDLALVREVDRRQLELLARDVLPHVELGPVRDREDADVLALADARVVEIPELGPLRARIPLAEVVAEGEDPLLRAAPLLVAPRPADRRVEAVLLDRVEQRRRLQPVARRARAGLLDDAPLVDRLLHRRDHEALAELGDAAVAVLDRLREVVPGVDVHDRERELAGPERLLGEPQQHDRVLAAREEQHRPLELGRDLAEDVDGLRLELVEVRERRQTRASAHARLDLCGIRLSSSSRSITATADSDGVRPIGLEPQLGLERLLVRRGDAGEVLDLAGEGGRVEALRIAPRALLERGRDVDLDERRVLLDERARVAAHLLVRRDRRDDHDRAGAREPRGDPADARDVRVAVLLREAEALREMRADDVAVEVVDDEAAPLELRLDDVRDRRLARAREPGEPEDEALAHAARVQPAFGLAPCRPSGRRGPCRACVECVSPIES